MNQETGLSFRQRLAILFFILAVSSAAAGALGQQDSSDEVIDPGPRIGGVGAGGLGAVRAGGAGGPVGPGIGDDDDNEEGDDNGDGHGGRAGGCEAGGGVAGMAG